MKIALFGKSGMLGSRFQELLGNDNRSSDISFHSFNSSDVDVTNFEAMKCVFGNVKPEIVINCTGYTNVDGAEKERDRAFAINGYSLNNFANLCKEYDSELIHFSTDYVFDGTKNPPDGYLEDDIPNPINTYGESKFLGEKFITEKMKKFFIIRTSWLFGPNGKNFVKTMLNLEDSVLIGKNESIKVVNDQIGSPTYTVDLSESVLHNFIHTKKEYGIYHLTNTGICSWFDFAKSILKNIKPSPISSSEFNAPAKRPKNSILINSKLPQMRNWNEALKDYMSFDAIHS